MNVAIFASAFHPHFGGVEELCRQLGHELARQGHAPIVLTNRWPRSLPASETFEGIPVYRLPFRVPGSGMKSWVSYHLTHRAIRANMLAILRRHRAEVLHVQCVSSNAAYAMEAKRGLNVPLVVTLQGELTMDAERIFERSRAARDTLWRSLKQADAVTGCSARTLVDAEAFFEAKISAPSRVIFNGASVDDFASARPFVRDRPYVFAIGRLVPQKGFDVLLRAFAVADLPSHDLVLAGDGPDRESLEALARHLGVDARVTFLGRKSRSDVPPLFKGCDFFVLPSRAHEGLPVVCAEAMAAGKAVVATRSGGAPEAVPDGEVGIIVERDDVGGLAGAMGRMADPGFRQRCERAARERASLFSWPVITRQYVDLYTELVRPVGAGRRAVRAEVA